MNDEDEEAAEHGPAGAPGAASQGPRSGAEGRAGKGDPIGGGEGTPGQADGVPDTSGAELGFPSQTPLFHAQHAERYARQTLIRRYEEMHDCRLIVMIDAIFPPSVTLFEELVAGADCDQDLHLMLDTPGGDGETAIRLVRSAQARCRELTVLVPNQAKSAGTILLTGAHHILMGPTSDLGPVDPQFAHPDREGLFSAKDLIAAVEQAEAAVAANPDTYPLYASLLADITGVMVQEARSALERSEDLVREALSSNKDRKEAEVEEIAAALKETLIDLPRHHGAVFGADDARRVGLPVIEVDPDSVQWRLIWMLWSKYFAMGASMGASIYEGRLASQVL